MKHSQNEQIKKIWISINELKRLQNIVDETYYNLCTLWIYWDAYYELQKMHWLLDDLMDNEYLEEDELDEVRAFYENHFKHY